MDKFGYIRGKRGPPGPKGKDAIPLYSWCPDAMLQMFRQSENCTYYFNDANSGILNNGITLVGNNSELYGYVISGKTREHLTLVLMWRNSPTSWPFFTATYIICGHMKLKKR